MIRNATIDYDPDGPNNVAVESIIGCTVEQFRQHISQQFQFGMSWNNYPQWRLDKFVPISYFNVNIPQEFYYCFNFRNFRPTMAYNIERKPIFTKEMYDVYKRNLPLTFRARYEVKTE